MANTKDVHVVVKQQLYDIWKEEADKRGISLPEFIRRAVTLYIADARKKARSDLS